MRAMVGGGFFALALVLAPCATESVWARANRSGFSFSECEPPSLMEILRDKKFEVSAGEKRWRLTNVHPSFDASFVIYHDEARSVHVIKSHGGRTVFEGMLDGVPRCAACVDLDRDGDQDVIIQLAAYGNHGNGIESWEVLLNQNGRLTHLKNSISEEYLAGQASRAGKLTWYSDQRFCAVFVGEEADLESDTMPGEGWQIWVRVGPIRRIREVWGHRDGEMRLISKSAVPICREETKHLTFR